MLFSALKTTIVYLSLLEVVLCLTVKQEANIRGYIRKAIQENIGARGPGTNSNLPGFVRLSFHDCVGGKCDGCINLKNPENKGLDPFINKLEEIYTAHKLASVLSRADLWALAGAEAVLYGALGVHCRPGKINCRPRMRRPIPDIKFRYGRKDCPTSPKTSAMKSIPEGHHNLASMKAIFKKGFPNLNDREMVCLIGAHTLGFAKANNLGWIGKWDAHPNWLDNEFYRDMVNSKFNWTQVKLRGPRHRFMNRYEYVRGTDVNRMPPGFTMLNSDMCLLKKFSVDKDGKSTCRSANTCPDSSTASIVREFAASNEKWIKEFGPAFTKMIENGYGPGVLKTPK